MSKASLLLGSLGSALALTQAAAQSPAIQQMDSVQQRRQIESSATAETGETAPELYPGESSDLGPQSVIRYKARKTHFEAMADAQYFYTDNLFLADRNEHSADVLVSTAQFALAPTPYDLAGGQFAPRIGYRHEWFTFGPLSDRRVIVWDFDAATARPAKLSEFDFNVQTIFTDLHWSHGNWTAGLGGSFSRLMDKDYNPFYREWVPRWSLQRLFPLNENAAFSMAYEGAYHFTDTDNPPGLFGRDFNDRTDHSLIVSHAQTLCSHTVLQPYYRFKYTHFPTGESREDYLHSFGVALYCFLTPNVSLRGFVSYDIMDTTSTRIQDYQRLDAGGGLNLTVRF